MRPATRRYIRAALKLVVWPHPVRSALLRRQYLAARASEVDNGEFGDLTVDWLSELTELAVVTYGGSHAPSDGPAVVTATELAVVTYGSAPALTEQEVGR